MRDSCPCTVGPSVFLVVFPKWAVSGLGELRWLMGSKGAFVPTLVLDSSPRCLFRAAQMDPRSGPGVGGWPETPSQTTRPAQVEVLTAVTAFALPCVSVAVQLPRRCV